MENIVGTEEEALFEPFKIEISEDGMRCYATFYTEKTFSLIDLHNELNEMGVIHGVNSELLKEIEQNLTLDYRYEIATGEPPIEGKDGFNIMNFNQLKDIKPKILDNGAVDFKSLDLINNVSEEDILIKIVAPQSGVPGIDVFGQDIPFKPVSPAPQITLGKNVKMVEGEDGKQIVSKIEGQVELIKNRISVNEVYTVQGDVDNSVGNIDFNGTVVIYGNVLSGFTIKCKRNVEVKGLVEGATIIAGGNVVVKSGVQGMDKAKIVCNGNLYAKYISNAIIKCNGALETASILHSDVSCNNVISLKGNKGLISGGKVRASKEIDARTIGSSLGTKTLIEVGVDPEITDLYNKIKEENHNLRKEITKLKQIVTLLEKKDEKDGLPIERKIMLSKSKTTLQQLNKTYQENDVKINKIEPILENIKVGMIKAQDIIYPGTIVTIGTQSSIINTNVNRCRMYLEGADIKIGLY